MKLHTGQHTAKYHVFNKTHEQDKYTTLTTDYQQDKHFKKGFLFLSRQLNPEYSSGLKSVPLRSCLLHHNVAAGNHQKAWEIKTKPKWWTNLLQTDFDTNTGEIYGQSVYRTDDLTAGNNRKIKAVNKFCNHFSEAYKMRKVSLLFYTFTVANQAKITIRECMDAFHKRLKRRNIKLHGYVWILEVSDNLHVHYHALIAIDRINCRGKKLPEYLKLNNVWGAICQVEFIKKSVRYYLATYFTKNKNRISGKRQYGLKLPKN
jgi:hypothetical protein